MDEGGRDGGWLDGTHRALCNSGCRGLGRGLGSA